MSLIVLTLEWSSVSGAEPVVFVGDDETVLRREAARYAAARLADNELEEVTPAKWAREGNAPQPDYDDPDSVRAWQAALWEWTTELRLTLYYAPGCEPDGGKWWTDTYRDVRATA